MFFCRANESSCAMLYPAKLLRYVEKKKSPCTASRLFRKKKKKADVGYVTELQYVLTEQKSLFLILIRLMSLCAYGSAQLLRPAVAKLRRCMEGSVMSQRGPHMTFNPGL